MTCDRLCTQNDILEEKSLFLFLTTIGNSLWTGPKKEHVGRKFTNHFIGGTRALVTLLKSHDGVGSCRHISNKLAIYYYIFSKSDKNRSISHTTENCAFRMSTGDRRGSGSPIVKCLMADLETKTPKACSCFSHPIIQSINIRIFWHRPHWTKLFQQTRTFCYQQLNAHNAINGNNIFVYAPSVGFIHGFGWLPHIG